MITNGILNSIADAVAQTGETMFAPHGLDAQKYDWQRTLRFALFGFAMGPLIGTWMKVLERAIPMKVGMSVSRERLQLVKRVMSDQLFM